MSISCVQHTRNVFGIPSPRFRYIASQVDASKIGLNVFLISPSNISLQNTAKQTGRAQTGHDDFIILRTYVHVVRQLQRWYICKAKSVGSCSTEVHKIKV